MDTLLNCILQIYRASHDTLVEDFQRTMLVLVQEVVPFRTAVWCSNTGFDLGMESLSIRELETFNEPESILTELPTINVKQAAFLRRIAYQPRVAAVDYAPRLYSPKGDGELRQYIRRYGHEHNLIIAGIETPRSPGNWLSLWRPHDWDAFSAKNQQALTLLMPHLVEARTINRRLASGQGGMESFTGKDGTKALIKGNGTILHAGYRFKAFLDAHWQGVPRKQLPARLLSQLQRHGFAVSGRVRIAAEALGQLQLLTISECSVASRLSGREYEVAQIYSNGKSYKEISKALAISPVTVRNVIQNIYRKLGINNKADLVRALMGGGTPHRLKSRFHHTKS